MKIMLMIVKCHFIWPLEKYKTMGISIIRATPNTKKIPEYPTGNLVHQSRQGDN